MLRVIRFEDLRLCLLTLVVGALVGCAQAQNDLPTLPDDPAVEPPSKTVPAPSTGSSPAPIPPTTGGGSSSSDDQILAKYSYLDPSRAVPTNLLREVVLYFDKNMSKFTNRSVITVIDFSQRSSVRRMHIVDMKSGSVWSMPVAHGKGSDPGHDGFAEYFSNVSGSNASSLGFYRGMETYYGNNSLSLRMDGLSSTNSNARPRAIVIHGADYVRDENVVQGRSWGCPAVPQTYRDRVMAMLKGGSLIYAGLSKKN